MRPGKRFVKQGYYLVTGTDFNQKKEFRELWHWSGIRLRRMTIWAEQENFKLENFYPGFVEEDAPYKLVSVKIVKIKYIGKSLIRALSRRA